MKFRTREYIITGLLIVYLAVIGIGAGALIGSTSRRKLRGMAMSFPERVPVNWALSRSEL